MKDFYTKTLNVGVGAVSQLHKAAPWLSGKYFYDKYIRKHYPGQRASVGARGYPAVLGLEIFVHEGNAVDRDLYPNSWCSSEFATKQLRITLPRATWNEILFNMDRYGPLFRDPEIQGRGKRPLGRVVTYLILRGLKHLRENHDHELGPF